jgi:hypothetical protein
MISKPEFQSRKTARLGVLFTILLAGVLTSNPQPGSALGTCSPTEKPNGIGVCQTCPAIITSASIASTDLNQLFSLLDVQNTAYYTITNNVGTLYIDAQSRLPQFNFKPPPPALISLPPVSGSLGVGEYNAAAGIADLTLTWNNWAGGDSGVIIPASLSGDIDVHLSGFAGITPFSVTPRLTLRNLPVTITFGTDASGHATILPSQVAVTPIGSYGTVNGCGAFDWCNGTVTNLIDSLVQGELRSSLASQLTSALNGQENTSPFWAGFMTAAANQTVVAPLLSDPAGFRLPLANQATSGGTTTAWKIINPNSFSYIGGKMTATFVSSAGLCYINCTPRVQLRPELCGSNSCGVINDGCGNTLQCATTCPDGETCTNNQCKPCNALTCASVGARCGSISNGCGGFIVCNVCGDGTRCDNGQCQGFGGPTGVFCQNCRKTKGSCQAGPGGSAVCIHQ